MIRLPAKLVVGLAVAIAALAAAFLLPRRCPASAPGAPRGADPFAAAPTLHAADRLAGLVFGELERTVREPVAAAERSAPARLESSAAVDALQALLEELRSVESAADYHGRALPIVRRLAGLVAVAPSIAEALTPVVSSEWQGTPRFRASVLVALALCLPDARVRPLADAARRIGPPELVRAAWLTTSLVAAESSAASIPLGQFRSDSGLSTYPLSLDRLAPDEDLASAFAFLRTLPAIHERDGPSAADDAFTQEVALIAALGTQATQCGQARNQLWAWLTDPPIEQPFLRDASAFCLCAAAANDPALARDLVVLADRLSGTKTGARLVLLLARIDGLAADVVPILSQAVNSFGDLADIVSRIDLITALGELLRSADAPVRDAATELAIHHALDPSRPTLSRILVLDRLAAARHENLLEVAGALLGERGDAELQERAAMYLRWVAPADAPKAVQSLITGYDETLPLGVRAAYVRTVGALGDRHAAAFLYRARASSAALETAVNQALAAIERRGP